MYKAGKRFLFWVMYFPLGVVISVYIMGTLVRTSSWLLADPDSSAASTKYIFLGVYDSFGHLLQRMSIGFIGLLIICLGIWLYECYSVKRSEK